MNYVDISSYQKAGTIALTHFDIVNSSYLYAFDSSMVDTNTNKVIDEWKIDLFFDLEVSESHKPLEFIYQFIEILNSIPGVKVTISDIIIGSLGVKLKAVFESVSSKEEVKEILESTKKFTKGKLEKDFEETEKIKKEGEKIEMEKKLLLQEIDSKGSLDTAYLKSLEIQAAEEDLKRKKLENAVLQVELIHKGAQAFSELLARGIISQKHFEMAINDIMFISINNGKLSTGEIIDTIDKS